MLQEHIGDAISATSTERIIAELQQRYDAAISTNTLLCGSGAEVQDRWRALLGERVLLLQDEAAVCETIALAIRLCEGAIGDLDHGTDSPLWCRWLRQRLPAPPPPR
ncbi:MAG: hypothetical protein U0Z44_11810 [Kouleothrix sp.]